MVDNGKQNNKPFKLYRFLLQSLDPVHVGVGGYRLGRVDLPIAREPGTNLPKLPGTSLNGAIRYYAALSYGGDKIKCAGQGDEKKGGHCGKPDCPICYTFGSLTSEKGQEKGALAATARIFDARILLFPVHSVAGPVWVTSPETLRDFGLVVDKTPKFEKSGVEVFVGEGLKGDSVLNLGWLMVGVTDTFDLSKATNGSPTEGDESNCSCQVSEGEKGCQESGVSALEKLIDHIPETIKNRVVLVPEEIFSHVVNSNLEVRTSVSIDPETGAAKQGALFIYEAIPRAAFFWLDVIENDYRRDFKSIEMYKWNSPIDVVTSGIKFIEYLGVGGMATRGFGRIKKIARQEVM